MCELFILCDYSHTCCRSLAWVNWGHAYVPSSLWSLSPVLPRCALSPLSNCLRMTCVKSTIKLPGYSEVRVRVRFRYSFTEVTLPGYTVHQVHYITG